MSRFSRFATSVVSGVVAITGLTLGAGISNAEGPAIKVETVRRE
jgi:hypothetical protein